MLLIGHLSKAENYSTVIVVRIYLLYTLIKPRDEHKINPLSKKEKPIKLRFDTDPQAI